MPRHLRAPVLRRHQGGDQVCGEQEHVSVENMYSILDVLSLILI